MLKWIYFWFKKNNKNVGGHLEKKPDCQGKRTGRPFWAAILKKKKKGPPSYAKHVFSFYLA